MKKLLFKCDSCDRLSSLTLDWSDEQLRDYGDRASIACKKCSIRFRPLIFVSEIKETV